MSYDGKNYDWSKGKLSRIYCGDSAVVGSLYESCSFTYNGYGQRVAKSYAIDPDPGSNSDYSYTYNTSYQYDHFGRLIREYCDERYIGGHTVKREFIYLYDECGMIGVMYSLNGAAATRYYYKRNLQGDVIALYDENGVRKVEYLYDAWGNCTTIYGAGTDLAKSNPIRYRGYYFDRETGLYYLNARYYNPQWRRFISPDDSAYLDHETVNGLNLYGYCSNDPVNLIDPSGHWIETVFDLFSLGASAVEVVINPADPWAWAGLVGDAVDLLPFVTGVGEGVKAAKLVKYADEAVDASLATIKFAKATDYAGDFAEGGLDLARALDRTSDGFTISNRLDGIKIHNSFMSNGSNIRGTRLRVDGLDNVAKRVYELKPFNRNNLRKGVKQILNYNDKLGGSYQMIIVFY